jgi:hypothetical protein
MGDRCTEKVRAFRCAIDCQAGLQTACTQILAHPCCPAATPPLSTLAAALHLAIVSSCIPNAQLLTLQTAGGLLQLRRVPVGDLHAGHPDARVPARRARAGGVPRRHPSAAGRVHELGPGAAAVSRGAGEPDDACAASSFSTVQSGLLLLDWNVRFADAVLIDHPEVCHSALHRCSAAHHGSLPRCLDAAAAHASRLAQAHRQTLKPCRCGGSRRRRTARRRRRPRWRRPPRATPCAPSA